MILNFGGLGWALMLFFGAWTLRTGRFYLALNCMVEGRVARVIGWLFVIPLLICFFADALVTVAFGRGEQTENARFGVYGVALAVALICPLVAVGLALGFGRPPVGAGEEEGNDRDEEDTEAEPEEADDPPPAPTTQFRVIRRKGRGNETDDHFRE